MPTIDDEDGLVTDPPEQQHPYRDLPHAESESYGPEDVLPARAPGHRARGPVEGTPSPLGRVLLPLALAVLSVVALLVAWGRLEADRADQALASPTTTARSSSSASASAPATPAPPSASTSATATSASSAPTPSPSTSTSAATSTSPPVSIDRSVPVTVLNGTRRTGLAAAVAAELRTLGWTVVSIGNWRSGGIPTTTVFVNGREEAAATMRRDLPAADATRKPIGQMKADRITVVVMDDYPRQ